MARDNAGTLRLPLIAPLVAAPLAVVEYGNTLIANSEFQGSLTGHLGAGAVGLSTGVAAIGGGLALGYVGHRLNVAFSKLPFLNRKAEDNYGLPMRGALAPIALGAVGFAFAADTAYNIVTPNVAEKVEAHQSQNPRSTSTQQVAFGDNVSVTLHANGAVDTVTDTARDIALQNRARARA